MNRVNSKIKYTAHGLINRSAFVFALACIFTGNSYADVPPANLWPSTNIGDAFAVSLDAFIDHSGRWTNPEKVASTVGTLIEAISERSPSKGEAILTKLLKTAGDFGLHSEATTGSASQNSLAEKVRLQAIAALGKIGSSESIRLILQFADDNRSNPNIEVAARFALARRGVNEAAGLFLDQLDPAVKNKIGNSARSIPDAISRIDPSIKNEDDIALLGLSRVKLDDFEVERVIGLIQTLGKKDYSGSSTIPLQRRLFLSLLESGQGAVLSQLTPLIAKIPAGDVGQDIYYWNQCTSNEQEELFSEMLLSLAKQSTFDEENATVSFLFAILHRQENISDSGQKFS